MESAKSTSLSPRGREGTWERTWAEEEASEVDRERKQLKSDVSSLRRNAGLSLVSAGLGIMLMQQRRRSAVQIAVKRMIQLDTIGGIALAGGSVALAPLALNYLVDALPEVGGRNSVSPIHEALRGNKNASLFEFSVLNKRMDKEVFALENLASRSFWFPKPVRDAISAQRKREVAMKREKLIARERELELQIQNDLKECADSPDGLKKVIQKLSRRVYVVTFSDCNDVVPNGSDLAKRPSERKNESLSSTAEWVSFLREIVAFLLEVASEFDEIVIKVDSPGGTVSEYGLAASELIRLRKAGLNVTCCIDTVCASGGYLMAACANQVVAAPFALVGSIGVIGEMPNFHRALSRYDVDYIIETAGKFKRTVHPFGETTEEHLQRFREQLEDIHSAFKDHVADNRQNLDVEALSSGEAWLASQSVGRGLVDKLQTSEEYLLQLEKSNYDIIGISLRNQKAKSPLLQALWDCVNLKYSAMWRKATKNLRAQLKAQLPFNPASFVAKL